MVDSSNNLRPHDWSLLIATLGLEPHPEGGYYREVFRSSASVELGGTSRSAATSIYYLLTDGAVSAWHRLDADEIWYFHAGGPLALHVLQPNGELITHRLGNPLADANTQFQAVVPAGHWFAAEPENPDYFCLVGCAVAPGFEFAGFQLASEHGLAGAIKRYGEPVRKLLKR